MTDCGCAFVEDKRVEDRHGFEEVLLEGQLQVTATIVVAADPGNREHSARLTFEARAVERRASERLLVLAQGWQVGPHLIEEGVVSVREEDPAEVGFDEAGAVWSRRQEQLHIVRVQPLRRVLDRRTREVTGEPEEVVGPDRLAHRLEQVRDTARARESIQCCLKFEVGKHALDPRQEPVF